MTSSTLLWQNALFVGALIFLISISIFKGDLNSKTKTIVVLLKRYIFVELSQPNNRYFNIRFAETLARCIWRRNLIATILSRFSLRCQWDTSCYLTETVRPKELRHIIHYTYYSARSFRACTDARPRGTSYNLQSVPFKRRLDRPFNSIISCSQHHNL